MRALVKSGMTQQNGNNNSVMLNLIQHLITIVNGIKVKKSKSGMTKKIKL